MLKKCYPNLYISSFEDIDLNLLREKNIKGLILDIDNTLVATSVMHPGQNVIKWIKNIKEEGIQLCIVSNASKSRVKRFNSNIKIHSIHRATKPSRRPFIQAANIMQLAHEEVAVVGDQIFCDILGGNKANMYTILVKPICKKEFWFVRLKRFPEKFVLSRYKKLKNKKKIYRGAEK